MYCLCETESNYAKVGRDATPYQLNSVYVAGAYGNNLASVAYPLAVAGGNVAGFGPGARLGTQQLTPEFVTSTEGGINIGLFRNRVGIDFNYFNTVSSNQIFNVAVSNSSGYNTRTTNIGKMTNKGIELVLSATPVKSGDFRWDVSLNYTRIRNIVNEIAPGVTSAAITGNGFTGITPSIYVDQPYGVIVGTGYARNANGDKLVNGLTGGYQPGVPNLDCFQSSAEVHCWYQQHVHLQELYVVGIGRHTSGRSDLFIQYDRRS